MKITKYIVQQIYTLDLADDKYSSTIYTYGINTGISILLNLLIILVISFFQNKMIVCLEFFCFFIPLRSISGGFHFTSKRICSVVSTLTFIFILNCQHYILKNFDVFLILTFFCILIIIIIPIKESNIRRLDSNEITNFQNKKKFLCNVYIIMLITLLLLGLKTYITPILSAIILIAILLSVDLIVTDKKKYTSS